MTASNDQREADTKFLVSFGFRDSRGKEIVSHNSDIPLLPASNQKILTGYAAFKILGADYHLKTTFSINSGELIISGGPTPLLFAKDFKEIVNRPGLLELPVTRNNFHVHFTAPLIDDIRVNDHWTYGDSRFSYQPLITNFSLNENCISTSGGEEFTMDELHSRENDFVPSVNPENAFIDEIRNNLNNSDDGKNSSFRFPSDEKGIYDLALSDILKHMETVSCNYSAEVVFKLLSSRPGRRLGNWNDSIDIMNQFIRRSSSKNYAFSIVDGSGLSRQNFLSTGLLSGIISTIVSREDFAFLNFLPSPGEGTLQSRLGKFSKDNIHAKTGSLGGVSSLTGYIGSRNVAFSIIVNNYLGSIKPSLITDAIFSSFMELNEVPNKIDVGEKSLKLDL